MRHRLFRAFQLFVKLMCTVSPLFAQTVFASPKGNNRNPGTKVAFIYRAETEGKAVACEPGMPFWDMIEPNVIRNSRWRCDHGWDIDLDDGSTRYRKYNNLLLNGGLKMRAGNAPDGTWGKELDCNLFVATREEMQRFAVNGCDFHSLTGAPLFLDPGIGDFRVKESSPAIKLGFVNFPMDQFGVTKPSLRAIAKTPVIPELKKPGINYFYHCKVFLN